MAMRHAKRAGALMSMALTAALLSTMPAGAQSSAPFSGEDWLRLKLSSAVRTGRTVERARQRLDRLFAASDIDGGGVSQADYDLSEQFTQASRRARTVSKWLQRDLDGDGAVSGSELNAYFGRQANRPLRSHGVSLQPTPGQIEIARKALVQRALREADSNGDGAVSYDEMRAAGDKNRRPRRPLGPFDSKVPMSLDRDGDEVVSRKEFDAAVTAVLGEIDSDGNGMFSADEESAFKVRSRALRSAANAARRAQRRIRTVPKARPNCDLPKPSPGARVVVIDDQSGKASGDGVSVGGGQDGDGVVEVSPGEGPLYLVVTGIRSAIWKISGAIARIEALVVSPKTPPTGVAGLPRGKVHLAPTRECLDTLTKARKS